ncbi:hypothetical protein E5163_11365 [Marinicauda algicola]|uniref:Uncharacterized protein n=1 Tax=Marinicauda algicola TaxID=2029849 RepID=A0A4V3RXZ2_9PROT|nr:hypothetical protein [Marinicauda algicola]TGY88409.1 hypothetical protein E5163_11365 [Marinicauda algicola]
MTIHSGCAAAALAAASLSGALQEPGAAAESVYTRIHDCLLIEEPLDIPVAISACPGHDGTAVLLAGGDHGSAVAFGTRGHEAQFAEAPPRTGPLLGPGEVIEWRVADGAAYATILRWLASDYENETVGNWLVVTALRPEGEVTACQVAYVDALSLAEANALAREVADRIAPRFSCGEDLPVRFDAGSPDLETVLAGWQARPR